MNAFPAELIQHHYACMLVAGLIPTQQQQQQQQQQNKAPTATTVETTESSIDSAKDSDGASSKQGEGDAQVQNAQQSSNKAIELNTASIPGPSQQPKPATKTTPTPSEAFPKLAKDLCEIFSSRGRSTAWDPARSRSAVFHSILVDHNVRLPPRKTRPTPRTLAAPASTPSTAASLPPRSPLSPLHPSSPLFPDGLIAPIWLRKHRDLVPSVFVAFYCLAEHSAAPPPTPPKDDAVTTDGVHDSAKESDTHQASENSYGLSGAELRSRDEALIKVISDRKRSLGERGIKFTVVLLAKRAMLDSPTLEQRLSFIRRSSQLDSRASLFVLTPVTKSELGEFVTSLQMALYDSALDYYREHYRRTRRKRAKYPPPPSIVSQIYSAAAELRGSTIKDTPLSKEGWLTRNEYKLGAFAELVGNLDDALTHYVSAYRMLSTQLLTSTLLLPPRTKRWAEAKVLADTLSFRIAKLLLYRDDGEGAWDQFRTHVRKFTELSQGWGIGEMTFEFWSWLAKQYRLMGDLLDLATRDVPGSPLPPFRPAIHFPPMPTFLLHPSHLPTPTASGSMASSYNPQHGNLSAPNDAAIQSHIIPSDLCPGAGDCFYIAGICALERWERFRRLQWEEQKHKKGNGDDTHTENWNIVSLTQEHKVDHAAQAIESLTRAHEIFKRQGRQRLSLFVASKIANAYVENEQAELALRFLERTAKSYELERWSDIYTSQLLLALECAQLAQDAESEGKVLWRLLGASASLDRDRRDGAVKATKAWLTEKTIKEEKSPLQVEWTEAQGPLSIEAVFVRGTTDLDDGFVPFQVCISARAAGGLEAISFDRLILCLQDGDEEIQILITNSDTSKHGTVTLKDIDLRLAKGGELIEAGSDALIWPDKTIRIYEGSIAPRKAGVLLFSRAILEKDGKAAVKLIIRAGGDAQEHAEHVQQRWYINSKPLRTLLLPFQNRRGALEVSRRKHKVKVSLKHEDVAFLDETYLLTVVIANEDSIALDCQVDVHVLGPPGEVISSDEVWQNGQDEGVKVSSIRDIQIDNILPSKNAEKAVCIALRKHHANRTIDVVLRSRANIEAQGEGEGNVKAYENEQVTSIDVPVKQLFTSSFYAQWRLLRDVKAIAASRRSDDQSEVAERESTVEETTALSVMADEMPYITAIASLNVSLGVVAHADIEIVAVGLTLDAESKVLRFWKSNSDASTQDTSNGQYLWIDVGGKWAQGDRWGGVFDIELLSESVAGTAIEAEDASLRPTGRLRVQWRRAEQTMVNTSNLSLPLLLPPHLLARLIVSLPLYTTLEQPLVMLITIVNPSRLASDIVISIDDSRSDFGIQSHRTFTVPNMLPRSTRSVPVHLAPRRAAVTTNRGQTASVRTLPSVRAWQRDRRRTAATTADAATSTAGSARTSLDSMGTTSAAAAAVAGRRDETLRIVNERPGAGVPLDVSLRYTNKASQAAAQATNDSQHQPNQDGSTVQHLQAETQKTGLWTVLVH